MTNLEHAEEELNRYIEQTIRIRELASPQISSFEDEEDYRKRLPDHFARIRRYAEENNRILNRYLAPVLRGDDKLGQELVNLLSAFSRKLHNTYTISYTDAMLMYRQAKRFLREADETDDTVLRIRALDFLISSCYHLSYMRMAFPATVRFREEGWQAVEAMLAYLEKDRFSHLHQAAKINAMKNTGYYLRLFQGAIFDDTGVDPARKSFILQSMIAMRHRLHDPFYLSQMPETFPAELHRISILDYIVSLTDDNNEAGYDREELEQIYAYTLELEKACHDSDISNAFMEALLQELPLFLCRNAYLAGKTDESTYKRALRDVFDSFEDYDVSEEMPTVVINTAREYLLFMEGRPVDAVDAAFLTRVYSRFAGYIHSAPKENLFGFLLADAATILALFIDVPGGIGFEELCLNTIAALHPPTYIHTLSVAAFSRCLTHHLIQRMPALFLGVCGCAREAQVTERAEEIEDFVYHAALCHDFGKLLVAETIMNYGRDLLEEEKDMIFFHPVAGARLLRKHEDTAPYADVALGHHKWFNNRGGYPEAFDIDSAPLKNVIAIVACADCLDAATDAVGRSYKEGKSLDRFLEELREESGSRHAPWLYPLLQDAHVRAEIEHLLTEGRDENYYKTYHILKGDQQKTREPRAMR